MNSLRNILGRPLTNQSAGEEGLELLRTTEEGRVSVSGAEGRGSLSGAEPQHGYSLLTPQVETAPASIRQPASIITGSLERLSALGTSMAGLMRQTPGRSSSHSAAEDNLLPVTRHDVERSSARRRQRLGHGENRPAAERDGNDAPSYAKLDSRLQREVLADTFNWGKAGKHAAKTVARGVTAGGTLFGSYHLVNGMIRSSVPESSQSTSQGFVAMGLLAPVYNEGKEFINGMRSAFTSDAKLSYAEALEKTHLRRQKETAEQLNSEDTPDDIRQACTKIDLALQQAFAASRRGDKVKFALIRGMMHWREDFLLRRPMVKQEATGLKTEDNKKALFTRMGTLMQGYADGQDMHLHDKLCGFATGMGARSLEHELPPEKTAAEGFSLAEVTMEDDWHQWQAPPHVPKQMMMLAGMPGTGKTHYVENILPKLLDFPVSNLVMPDKQAGGVQALMGAEWSALEQEEFVTADTDALGKIGLKLIRAGCTNPILFLDEADLDDMDGIKRLTDPSRHELEATALETVLNFREVTIMLGVNAMKKAQGAPADGELGQLDLALADRLEMAIFNSTSENTKRSKAIEAYHGWAGLYCLPVKGGEGPILDDHQQTRLQDLFKGSLDHLVNFHHDKAGIPGARMWVPVASVTNFIAWSLLNEKHSGGEPLDQEKVNLYIEDLYAPRLAATPGQASLPQGNEAAESSSDAQARAGVGTA